MKQTTNMARVIGQIQTMARKINTKWFNGELPMDDCIWTVSSQPTSYGFFTPYNSYKIYDKVSGERDAVQISLGSEFLNIGIESVVCTLIHEMTHWYNFIHGVKDCSRNNRYHSKKFRIEAEKHGVHIDYDASIGWSLTSPTEDLIEWIIEEGFEELRISENLNFASLLGGLNVGGGSAPTTTIKKPKTTNSIKLVCPVCGQIARTTNPDHKIGCWDCMVEMIEA